MLRKRFIELITNFHVVKNVWSAFFHVRYVVFNITVITDEIIARVKLEKFEEGRTLTSRPFWSFPNRFPQWVY